VTASVVGKTVSSSDLLQPGGIRHCSSLSQDQVDVNHSGCDIDELCAAHAPVLTRQHINGPCIKYAFDHHDQHFDQVVYPRALANLV
jgi:hypothetical protein